MKSLLPLLFITTLLFISCNDDDATPTVVTLPPITSEGLNTFGCLINGEPWVAMTSGVEDELDVYFDEPNKFLTIQAVRDKGTDDAFFSIAVPNIYSEGTYQILDRDIFAPLRIFTDFESNTSYHLDTNVVRFFEITLIDRERKIISGNFEFTLIEEDFKDTLKITEGRIDAKYRK